MNIKTLIFSYGIAVMGSYCINCTEHIQNYYKLKEDAKV